MAKNKYPKLRNTKVKDSVSEVPDHSDILAITKGHFGKPVTRSGRFINVNHPPKDATKEEPEDIENFWGEGTVEDGEWAEALRNRVVKKKSEPSPL